MALLLLAYCIEKIAPCTPLTYLSSKRRRFVTSYVQPVIQQYESTTVLKRTFVIKVTTTDDFCNKWKPSHAIDTFRGDQR